MKVSIPWLQKYFSSPLPGAEKIKEALTFHAFEIEEVLGDVLDVKVLPDRAGYALSHRGIAKEISAILNIPLKKDSLRESLSEFPQTNGLSVDVDDAYVLRHMGALFKGVKVGPSPSWLKEALESIGQRSINNIVDATNYVMLDIGQPMHAFDADKIARDKNTLKIQIRSARKGEKITILNGEEYALEENMFVIADATSGTALDIAGLKGGLASGISEETKNIFISVGNYDGALIRKMSQRLKLFTDASQRYQNRPSPELVAFGMREILSLIKEVAGGEAEGVVDVYPRVPEKKKPIFITGEDLSERLGLAYSDEQIADVFARLDISFKKDKGIFEAVPPFERSDLSIPEDIAEEVGRIIGYDALPSTELLESSVKSDQSRFRGIERMKDQLAEKGFTEVSTQSFTKKGEVMLANPLDSTRPALRKNLEETLNDALSRALYHAPLVFLPKEKPKLFEVGTVFGKEGEYVELRMTERVPEWGDDAKTSDNLSVAKLEEYGKDYLPLRYTLGSFAPFSAYPFIVRDIALWVPEGVEASAVQSILEKNAGALLLKCALFDTFSKEGRVSYAFRLVFQSADRTLTDEEIGGVMKSAEAALKERGWEIR